jgi:hypothetical protein
VLERLVSRPPPRLRDRALDAVDPDTVTVSPSRRADTVDVACWAPVEPVDEATTDPEPRTTLLADPSLPGATDGPVTHTLVLEVDAPTRSISVDYRSLDASVVPDHGVRVRTDDDESVAVSEAHATHDGTFGVRLAEPQTDGALFVEYAVTRNPAGGQHVVSVVVNGVRETAAQLVVVG